MATRYKLVTQERVESITGTKTFNKDKLLVKGTSTGTTNLTTANTSSTSYTATFPAKDGTVAMAADVLPLAGGTMTGTITTKVGEGIQMPSGSGINLKLPTTDAYCTGNFTDSFQSGATVAAGNLVYMGSSSKWLICDADAIATAGGLIGLAMEAKNDTQAMKVALPGSFVRFDSWNWTPGVTLYISETAGGIATAIPTGADGVVRVIGFAVDADTIYFNPSSDNSTVVA